MNVDRSAWTKIGESDNAEFFEIEPRILGVVPRDGVTDDERTAQESVRIQLEHLRPRARRAGVIVFLDPVADQTSSARSVYRDQPDPAYIACYALVGGTPFGRAVGSLFIGINPPRVPTKLYASYEEALSWVRRMAGDP